MKKTWLAGLLLVLSIPASADLGKLLQYQKIGDPGAYVSSGFHDWRTVSKYRRNPGLHAGYDIAMLAGSPVRAAWPGKVVAITPWYGQEHGVTIQHSDGHEATYGHITPRVTVGQSVQVGDILGAVVVDHVDVKVRDSGGAFVDFASRRLVTIATPQTEESTPRFTEDMKKQIETARQQAKLGLLAENDVVRLEAQLKAGGRPVLTAPKAPTPRLEGRAVTDLLVRASHPTDLPKARRSE
jgi:peptidase M23-like protein